MFCKIFSHWIFRRVFFSGIILFLIIGGMIAYNYNASFSGFDSQENKKVCGVIFGAAVLRGNVPSDVLADRIFMGEELWENGLVNCLVLSGGASGSRTKHEVDVMKDVLIKRGVETDFILDYEGNDTASTIKNLSKKDSVDFVFVSSGFHLTRIGLFARREGIERFALQEAVKNYGPYRGEVYYFFREIVAILWYFKWEILIFVLFLNFIFSKFFWRHFILRSKKIVVALKNCRKKK